METQATRSTIGQKAIAIIMAIVLALGLCPMVPYGTAPAYADELAAGQLAAQADEETTTGTETETATLAEKFAYNGMVTTFIKANGDAFGMFKAQEGTTIKLEGSNVIITYKPQNKTVYKGFYLNASNADTTTWKEDAFIAVADEGATYNITLPDTYCGYAWPIAPVKVKDGKSTGDQYYLAIPSKENIAAAAAPITLSITNNTSMFKAETASAQVKYDGSVDLTMALSSNGYQNLFMGTYEEAVANGSDTTNWIEGKKNAADKWEFKIPVAADQLGTDLPVVSISQSYLDKFKAGENSVERAFYPRMLNLDLSTATLATDDYKTTKDIAVTKKDVMFSAAPTSALNMVGGPNSNNYAATLALAMEKDSFDKAFIGSAEDAEDAAETEIVPFEALVGVPGAVGTFSLKVRSVETPGDLSTVTDLADGTGFMVSFHSVSKDEWYERVFALDAEEGTLHVYDGKPARQTADAIDAIYVQQWTSTTDADCARAKALWDALEPAQQDAVEGDDADPDYFGRDTGDASKDDPLNQDGIGENEILVVSFGTSFNDSRVATIGGIEKALQSAYPGWSVRRAFTAQIIINHIQARDGEKIDNVKQAMDRAVTNGVKNLVIQPTHLMHGAEYDELKLEIDKYADKMTITYSEPLLGPVGATEADINDDKKAVGEAAVAAAVKEAGFESIDAAEKSGTAFVFMGHGTGHAANITYNQMQTVMSTTLGYKNVFIGTVEGEPENTACPVIIENVKNAGYKNVILRPLMVVAGDHANNDMADKEDPGSWVSQFTAAKAADGTTAAFENVTCQIKGLGEIPAVQQLYVAHVDAAAGDKIAAQKAADESAAKAVADAIAKIPADVTTDAGKKAVADARAAYDKLTDYQKSLVDAATVAKLTTAEDNVKKAEEATPTTPAKNSTFKVAKAKNSFKVKAGKKVVLKAKKLYKVSGNKGGKVTFKKANKVGKKKITVAKNGNITVKKGLKAKTYTVKVKATAKATAKYAKATKSVKIKIVVK